MKRYLPFILILLVAIGAVAGGVVFYRHKVAELTPVRVDKDAKLLADKTGGNEMHIRGPENALVTVEEFGDFQCPPCGILAPTMIRMEQEFGPKLRVIFREFPLVMHNHAAEAARAAEAAGMQGKFWEMHDHLFATQLSWSKEVDVKPTFLKYAEELGLNLGRFERDYDGSEVRERIAKDQARGTALGVKSTPTLFINDHPLPPPSMNEPALREAIAAAARGEPLPAVATPAPAISQAPPSPSAAAPSTTPAPTSTATPQS